MPNVGPSQILLLGSLDPTGVTMTGVTTGTSLWIDRSLYIYNAVYLRSIGVTSGGTILIEEADWMPTEAPYSGTAISNTSVAANTFTGGAQAVARLATGAYGFVRVRISSAITGGGAIVAILRSVGAS